MQRTWTHLESIFMSSEDIRKQLPDDSARFDRIDAEFKVNRGSLKEYSFIIIKNEYLFVIVP